MDVALQQAPSPGDQSPFSFRGWIDRFSPRHVLLEAPPATRWMAISMVFIYFLCRVHFFASLIGLVPAYTFSRLFVWNIVTAGFYHAHFIDLVFSVATLLLVGRYLEPFWGTREFVKFVLLVSGFGGLGCEAWNVSRFVLGSGSSDATQLMWPLVPYGGFGGVVSAFAVVGKQLIPDYEMTIFAFIPVRVKSLPLILLASNAFWHLLGFPVSSYSFIFTGTITSWVYLRYYQRRTLLPEPASMEDQTSSASNGISANQNSNASNTVIGDRRDSMAFISFFPESTHAMLNRLCFCCAISVSPPDILPLHLPLSPGFNTSHHRLEPKNESSTPPPDVEAQRRRLLALQQVDARIAKMKASKAASSSSAASP